MMFFDSITRSVFYKWRFYRNTIVFCFFLNVLCVMTGMCLGVDYWHSALQREKSEALLFDRLEASERLQTAVQNLKPAGKKDSTFEFANWSEIKIQLRDLGQPEMPLDAMADAEMRLAYLNTLEANIRLNRAKWIKESRKQHAHDSHVVRLLIVVSLLTIVFGLLLPLYSFSRIARLLVKTKDDLQNAAKSIVADWLKAAHRFGEEPFKNFEFWLHILLVAAAYVGESSRHPAAQVAGELAGLIRSELKKNGIAFEADTRPRA